MAPSKLSATQSSPVQAKKQSSISNFFTRKPSAAAPTPSKSTPATTNGISASEREQSLFVPATKESTLNKTALPTLGKRRSEHFDSDAENLVPGAKRQKSVLDVESDDSEDEVVVTRRQTKSRVSITPPINPGTSRATDTERTSKYIFSSSSVPQEQADEVEDEELRRYKEKMHQRFVRKLVKPDSIAEIKRRNNPDQEVAEGEEGEDGEDDAAPAKQTKGKKPGGARANGKLTPMEQQYLDIKRKHLDTIIVYQVGYKYRIFGEDARIASKELSFFLIPGKFRYDEHPSEAQWSQFAACSFPLVSLNTHVKRLVAAGHKVGVVKQIETAALKAVGDNRNAPFVRKLTNVYTKGTYVDDIEGLDAPTAAAAGNAPSTGYLLCLTESNARGWGNDEKVHVGIIAVQPATGSIIFDDFEDGFMRSEIETRLLHIAPCEYLIVGDLSAATDKLVRHLSGSRVNVFGDQARLERIEKPKTMAAQAYSHISNFYAEKSKASRGGSQDERSATTLDRIHQLTEHVTICLSAMIKHLTEYGLEHVFDLTNNFQSFSARTHMLLNGNTLNSLEIYRNQTDHTENGSLFWNLDRTKTRFGKRMLRNWVGRPLLRIDELQKRINAVEEVLQGGSARVDRLKSVISSVKGDLEKVLIRIYYKKAARPELLGFLQNLQGLANNFNHVKSAGDAGFESEILNEAVAAIPRIGEVVVDFLERINAQSAKDDDKYTFFRAGYETEACQEHTMGIAAVEHELEQHRAVAGQKLGKKKVDYITVAQTEYLIEVLNDKASLKKVPASWVKVSNTKKASRFHTPEVIKMIRERDQHREALAAACDDAYNAFLGEISTHYQILRECIHSLAIVDCLLSLAEVSSQPGYVKPTFTESPRISVTQGRHPMVEQILLNTYVPNDVQLTSGAITTPDVNETSALLITGPNMGGKSSYVRSVALVAIMGQIGCYVPAASAELGMLDAVFTRMGAFDNMMRGESTFMVELGETADILKQATPRSLVILDELGRGTSTHDGVAIAEAVLREMVNRGIMTLFITHYQALSRLESSCRGLKNVHMRFTENKTPQTGDEEITFLYEVGDGVAHRSYGLNVARLANIPPSVLDIASVKSKELELSVERRKAVNLSNAVAHLLGDANDEMLAQLAASVEQL